MSALRRMIHTPIWLSSRIIRQSRIRQFHLALSHPIISPVVPPLVSLPKILLPSMSSTLIPIFTGIWDAILRAVPKKKTTHSRKRKRQLVGKALEDKRNLTRCEACGDWKLLHTLCGNCVKSIQKDWRKRERYGTL